MGRVESLTRGRKTKRSSRVVDRVGWRQVKWEAGGELESQTERKAAFGLRGRQDNNKLP